MQITGDAVFPRFSDSRAGSDTSFSVIDGQQRLVSLSIIIAALRDLEHDEEWMRLLDALIVEPGDKLRGITSQPG